MSDHDRHRQRLEGLLSQDFELTDDLLRRQRMELELTLKTLEDRARKIRRASLIGVGLTICVYLAVLPMEAFHLTRFRWVAPLWAIVGNLTLLTTGILLTLYWHKYRPAIDRQRSEIQMSVLTDIQRQLADLQAEVRQRGSDDLKR